MQVDEVFDVFPKSGYRFFVFVHRNRERVDLLVIFHIHKGIKIYVTVEMDVRSVDNLVSIIEV